MLAGGFMQLDSVMIPRREGKKEGEGEGEELLTGLLPSCIREIQARDQSRRSIL
jgi:hypothetical protein